MKKVGLKLNIQKTKIMVSGPITSWEIGGETVETVSEFIFRGSQITADGDCSHEIKKHLLLGRKVMTNLDSILKSRDISLPTKVHLVKTMVFPVVIYIYIYIYIYVNLAVPWGMQDLSSLNRDWTCAPCIGSMVS